MDKQSVEYILMKEFSSFYHLDSTGSLKCDMGFDFEGLLKLIKAARQYERENLINGFVRLAFGYDAPNVAIEQIVEKMK